MPVLRQPKGPRGWAALKKTGGQTGSGPALNTVYSFPVAAINPRNPANFAYLPVCNVFGAPSVRVQGKKTPSFGLANIPLKASFNTSTFFNSLIGGAAAWLDTYGDSDEYACAVHNGDAQGTGQPRVYDGGKCAMITLEQTAVGGVIFVSLSFLCQYGDSEKGTPTSFVAPSGDAGNLLDVTNVDWNNTADGVLSWRLTLMRPQGYQMYGDGTLYSDTLESGNIGGFLRLVQTPLANVVPSTSATLKIGGAGGVQYALNLSKDERQEDVVPALGTMVNDYTLYNSSGAYPVAITTI